MERRANGRTWTKLIQDYKTALFHLLFIFILMSLVQTVHIDFKDNVSKHIYDKTFTPELFLHMQIDLIEKQVLVAK